MGDKMLRLMECKTLFSDKSFSLIQDVVFERGH